MKKSSYVLPVVTLVIAVVALGLELYRLHLVLAEQKRRHCNLLDHVTSCVDKIKAKV